MPEIAVTIEPGHQAFLLAYRLADLAGDFDKKAYERFCQTGEKETDPVWVQFTDDAKFFWRLSKQIGKVR